MAYTTSHPATESLLHTLARPFVAIGNALIALAEASTMAQESRRISEMSDEDLAAEGLTREQAIKNVFAAHLHV